MHEEPERRGLLIDLGGVVQKGWIPLAEDWADRVGVSVDELLSAIYGGNDDTVLIGAVTEDEWWILVQGRLDIPRAVVEELRRALIETFEWDQKIVAFLRGLRGIIPTALVSNAWPLTLERLTHHGVDDIVDEFVISGAVGFRKPDPRIYELALDRLCINASNAIFVDDSPEYVAAAEALGIAGHVHTETSDTIHVIKQFMGLGKTSHGV